MKNISIKRKILDVLEGGDILFIIPPFGSIHDTHIGPLNIEAIAKEIGFKTDLLYLNTLLASVIGVDDYEKIYNAPLFWMIGERLFARSAYDLPPLGRNPEYCADEGMSVGRNGNNVKLFYDDEQKFDLEHYLEIEQICESFINDAISAIVAMNPKMVGCATTAIGQTNCGVALLKGLKKQLPEIMTIIGGSNCDGKMADGIASLSNDIDYIFSGESETSFSNFLKEYSSGKLPSQQIVAGALLEDLDSLPFPDYDNCLKQYSHFIGRDPLEKIRIWYETSRGCWWAQQSKRCNFCSIYTNSYRRKSVDRVVRDLKKSKTLYPTKMLFMTDNIMPQAYHKELLPLISNKEEYAETGYQLRSNLDLQDILSLRNANVNAILPGIETLSTNMLRMMQKGVYARQNYYTLRNSRCFGLFVDWNIIWGLPGDRISDYHEMLDILPLIRHLQPPNNFTPLLLMRFSPYLLHSRDYDIFDTRPWTVFNSIYPDGALIDRLATYYHGRYKSESLEHPEIMCKIANEIKAWRKEWRDSMLIMENIMAKYVIYDNRKIHPDKRTHVLDYARARETMTYCVYRESEHQKWAVEQKLGIVQDSWYVPLVSAAPELLIQLDKDNREA